MSNQHNDKKAGNASATGSEHIDAERVGSTKRPQGTKNVANRAIRSAWRAFVRIWGELAVEKKIEFGLGLAIVFFTAWMVMVAKGQRDDFVAPSQKELRPYVYLSRFLDDSLYARGVYDLPKGKMPKTISFLLSNSGQTPAYDVHMIGQAIFTAKPPEDHGLFRFQILSPAHLSCPKMEAQCSVNLTLNVLETL